MIVLAEYEDDEEIFHAIMAGASAFLTKGIRRRRSSLSSLKMTLIVQW